MTTLAGKSTQKVLQIWHICGKREIKRKSPRRSGAKILIFFRAWLFAFHKFKVLFHLLENPHGGVVQLSVRLAPAVHNGA